MSDLASTAGEIAFAAIQTDIDTFTMPTISGTIPVTASPEATQEPVNAENSEFNDSWDELPGDFVGYNMGQLKLSTLFRVSGSPGVLPPLHPLLLSVYGRHVENAGTDVRYQHYRKGADPWVYLSLIIKREFNVEYITGAIMNVLDIKVAGKKMPTLDFSGFFKKKVKAGRAHLLSAIDGTSTPVTVIPFRDSESFKRYEVGAYCAVGSDDNSGGGFEILSIDTGANTMTIKDGVTTAQSADAVIQGFAPVASITGEKISAVTGFISLDAGAGNRDVAFTEAAYKLDNGLKTVDDQVDKSVFTGGVAGDRRKVTFDVTKYLAIEDLGSDFDIKNQNDISGTCNFGEGTGTTAKIVMPLMRMQKAANTGSPVKTQPSHKCHPSTGNDASELIIF